MKKIKNNKTGLIIGVGFHKTGTSSLRRALRILGYKVKDTSDRLIMPIMKGNYKPVLKTIDKFDAVEDTPWFMIYKELDQMVPNCKFILTIRDESAWYKSVCKHIGNLRTVTHEWIYGRGKGIPSEDEAHARSTYNKHNQTVLEYFKDRPEDLLIMDITKGDGWDKLCPFLGLDVPTENFPHNNKTRKNGRKSKYSRFKITRKQIKNKIKIKYLDIIKAW